MTELYGTPLNRTGERGRGGGGGECLICHTLTLTLLVMFCNQGAGYTGMFSLSKFFELYTSNFFTFLYAHFASINVSLFFLFIYFYLKTFPVFKGMSPVCFF